MQSRLVVHRENPQHRLIAKAAEGIAKGLVIVYPTDSSYALGCALGDKAALDRIRQIRASEIDHDFTLVCRDLSEIATYARVENSAYRLLKSLNLPTRVRKLPRPRILSALKLDKKSEGGRPRFVLPEAVGRVKHGVEVPAELVHAALRTVTL